MVTLSSGISSLRPTRAALYARSASALNLVTESPVNRQVSELRTYTETQG